MKILLLHASAGGGHKRAAEALADTARSRGIQPIVRDILDFVPPLYRKTYAGGYLRLIRAMPEVWGYLYTQTHRNAQRPIERNLRSIFNKLNAFSFYRFLRKVNPDAVICTHFMPLELIASRRPRAALPVPLAAVVTDFAAHSLWYCKGAHHYFVASEEAARQLIRKGHDPSRITLSGIPVMPPFQETTAPADALKTLGLDPRLPAVLILSGGYGVGPTLKLMEAFLHDPPACQLLISAGKNPAIEAQCRALAQNAPLPITVFGFVPFIHTLMDAASFVISKPGGLTCAEVLAKGKPLLIVEPVPGQEQRNAEYLLENGCALRLFETEEAPWKIRALLADPERSARISAAARRLAQPRAAEVILEAVLREVNTGIETPVECFEKGRESVMRT